MIMIHRSLGAEGWRWHKWGLLCGLHESCVFRKSIKVTFIKEFIAGFLAHWFSWADGRCSVCGVGDIGFRIFWQPVSHREEQHVLIRGGTAMAIVLHLKYAALGKRGSSTVSQVSQCTGARPPTFKFIMIDGLAEFEAPVSPVTFSRFDQAQSRLTNTGSIFASY